MDRRTFLRVSLGAGGALLIAACDDDTPSSTSPSAPTQTGAPGETASAPTTTVPTGPAFTPNLFISIAADGTTTLTVHRTEMGQGVRTALAMVLADELEVDLAKVNVAQSPANEAIGSQVTSGSGSIADNLDRLRKAAAVGRRLLVLAAAQQWGVEPDQCRAERGEVINDATAERLAYGDLVEVAASLDVPSGASLKTDAELRLIGTSAHRLEGPEIVTGSLQYGIDVRVPGMRFAAVARCPVPGGTVVSFDDTAARSTPGVADVVQIPSGVAVVAASTWAALRGRDALVVEWDDGDNARWDTASIRAEMVRVLGDGDSSDTETEVPADPVLEAVYETPYLAHLPMEPMNATALVRDGACEVWVGTQNPLDVQRLIADELGMDATKVVVHVLHCGGGFGRRLEPDVGLEAAHLSQAIDGPVMVTWSRTDDLQHDFPHAPTMHALRTTLAGGTSITGWHHRVAGPGLNGIVYTAGTDALSIEQAVPYEISGQSNSAALVDVPLRTGPWRGTFAWPSAFATECFLDEIAEFTGQDPVELRRGLLRDDHPLRRVLDLAVDQSDWGTETPAERGRGVACHSYHGSAVAIVAEVQAIGTQLSVVRIVCAIDCGRVVNPDMVVQQIEGGIVYGLTALLKPALTHARGAIEQTNFDTAPLLQMAERPHIDVHIVPSTQRPTGAGEMAVPAVIPAVLNAYFAASRTRVRSVPFSA